MVCDMRGRKNDLGSSFCYRTGLLLTKGIYVLWSRADAELA